MSQCGHTQPQDQSNLSIPIPEVRVNGQLISEDEIAAELQYHPAESAEEAIEKSAEALVIRALLLHKASELGVKVSPNNDESQEEALIRGVLELAIDVPLADDDVCRKYYDANMHKFKSPPLLEVNHILLGVPPDDIAGRRETREQAENLIQILEKNPQLFAEFANEFSACPSKKQGGNLGQISSGQTVPEFEKQLFLLGEGLASKPIESRYGFHIVNIANRIEGEQLTFALSKARIADYLKDHAYVKAVGQYIDVLMSESEIIGLSNRGSGTPLVQ